MKRKGKGKVCISLCLFLSIVLSVMGCAQSGGSGFLRKEFLKYENMAVLPFEGDDTGEVAKAFARNFHERFPQISILGGRKFLDNPQEEKFNLNQLDDATRLKIGRREAFLVVSGFKNWQPADQALYITSLILIQ